MKFNDRWEELTKRILFMKKSLLKSKLQNIQDISELTKLNTERNYLKFILTKMEKKIQAFEKQKEEA